MSDTPINHRRFLSGAIAANPFWQQFADAVTEVNDLYVTQPRRRLQNIREPEGLERTFLIANLRQLGFDYQSDFIGDDDYRRLLHMWSLYLPENGTEQFVNFLGYIKNTRFEIQQLWTKDYQSFIEPYMIPDGGKITQVNTGFWPSSHIRLYYDIEKFPIEDFSDIYPLFYKIAPIHLVLERIVGSVYSPPQPLTLAAAGHVVDQVSGIADMMPVTAARHNLRIDAYASAYVIEGAAVDAVDRAGRFDDLRVVGAGHLAWFVGGAVQIYPDDLPWVPPVEGDTSVAVTDLHNPNNLTANLVMGMV